jgi:hypothetical protein
MIVKCGGIVLLFGMEEERCADFLISFKDVF